MTDRLTIVGAGLAGLLAARMLRHRNPVIHEQQRELPNNHSAVLRFESSVVGDVLGIEFKRVNMIKATLPWRNPIADGLAYSAKNLGTFRSDRSLPTAPTSAARYIAPPDLIERMARGLDVELGQPCGSDFFARARAKVLSTMPMPSLMDALYYPDAPEFKSVPGINVRATVANCDAYVSLYVPDPDLPFSRVSITGDELIAECPGVAVDLPSAGHVAMMAAEVLGLSGISGAVATKQKYFKIAPIDEGERRKFIYWASSLRGKAWQLGRYATWRPGLKLDDLVKDIRLIDKWMSSKSPEADMEMHERRRA